MNISEGERRGFKQNTTIRKTIASKTEAGNGN